MISSRPVFHFTRNLRVEVTGRSCPDTRRSRNEGRSPSPYTSPIHSTREKTLKVSYLRMKYQVKGSISSPLIGLFHLQACDASGMDEGQGKAGPTDRSRERHSAGLFSRHHPLSKKTWNFDKRFGVGISRFFNLISTRQSIYGATYSHNRNASMSNFLLFLKERNQSNYSYILLCQSEVNCAFKR